jgi:hypothetical protein
MISGRRLPPLLPHQRVIRAFVCLSVLLILGVCYFSGTALFKWPCVFHAVSGLPCPLCGGTRAACAILHGDLKSALRLNVTALPALVTLVVVGFLCAWETLRGRPLAGWSALMRRNARWLLLVIPLLLAWWILHLVTAVKGSKSELVDFKKPIAARIRDWLGNAR